MKKLKVNMGTNYIGLSTGIIAIMLIEKRERKKGSRALARPRGE
jgi:hypothetical protein